MNITLLYCDDCPSLDPTLERLKKVLSEENVEQDISLIKVKTPKQAVNLRFIGSPTILINGIDIDPPTEDSYFALNCRAFRKKDGKISPIPPIEMIRKLVVKQK